MTSVKRNKKNIIKYSCYIDLIRKKHMEVTTQALFV